MDLDNKVLAALEVETKTMPTSLPKTFPQLPLLLALHPSPSIAHIIRSTITSYAYVCASSDSISKVATAYLTPSSQLFVERIKSIKIAAVYAPKVSILLEKFVTSVLPTLATT